MKDKEASESIIFYLSSFIYSESLINLFFSGYLKSILRTQTVRGYFKSLNLFWQITFRGDFKMTKIRFAKLKILFLTLFLLAASANAQTTAFTYQGRLNDSSVSQPTNGSYDFLFKIFDAGGIQQGGQIQVSNVAVANGIFTVQLDFGTVLISPASNLFLEIAVRPAGPQGPYTVLNPRQQITSAPFAVQSLNAASAVDAQNLGGIAANQYVVTLDPRLSDARNPLPGSSNYIQNGAAQQSANFN